MPSSQFHPDFGRRFTRSFALSTALILAAWAAGAVGYHATERLDWVDAFLNAAMILTGMGPVSELHTVPGKVFASVYALFSGVFFLTMVAVLFGPFLHSMLHRFHLELQDDEGE